MKTLLVSVDFSAATRAVIDAAVELAAPAHAKIVLHHSYVPPVVTSEYGLSLEMLQETAQIGEKTARHQLEHLEDELTANGYDVSSVLTEGGAAAQVLLQAAKHRADLIVLGSHGHTAFYDLLIGSTTHDVLAKAMCPVLIVPPAKNKAAKKAKKADKR
jgi:nucleotide-binding universal stress UspA family protein